MKRPVADHVTGFNLNVRVVRVAVLALLICRVRRALLLPLAQIHMDRIVVQWGLVKQSQNALRRLVSGNLRNIKCSLGGVFLFDEHRT